MAEDRRERRYTNANNKRRVEFARLIFEGKSRPEAARLLGISPETARDWLERDDVRAAIAKMKGRFEERVVEKAAITREAVLQKYWEFASIDPGLTKYNTGSQCQALDSIREMMGWTQAVEEETAKATFYRAKWNQGSDSLQ